MSAKPSKWTAIGRRNVRRRLLNLKEEASNIFHYDEFESMDLFDFILIPAVTLNWKGANPIWAQIIGAPGSGKTAHIQLYDGWKNAIFLSRLTKNSLISGYVDQDKKGKDFSLLPQLNGKLLVIKDFTCILTGPREERDAITGQLRDMYDGKASRHVGNIGLREYTSRFNMLLCVTGVIDGFHSISAQLGERFIGRREHVKQRMEIGLAAIDNVLKGTMVDSLQVLTRLFQENLDRLPIVPINAIGWSSEYKRKTAALANLVALSRSHVIRSKDGISVATRPSPEVPTRLATQVVQCASAYCIINGIEEINEDAFHFGIVRTLRDTLTASIVWILYHIWQITRLSGKKSLDAWFTQKDLLPLTRLSYREVSQHVTDLYYNNVLVAYHPGAGSRGVKYILRPDLFELMEATNFFGGFDADKLEMHTLPMRLRSRERSEHTRRKKNA